MVFVLFISGKSYFVSICCLALEYDNICLFAPQEVLKWAAQGYNSSSTAIREPDIFIFLLRQT